jgi:hypothetical protein
VAQVVSHRVACNLCRVDGATVVCPAGVAQLDQIVRCNRCNLIYASPRGDAEPVQLDYVSRSLTLDRLAYTIGVISGSPSFQKRTAPTSRRLGLNEISFHLTVRDMQRVYVRKAAPCIHNGGFVN